MIWGLGAAVGGQLRSRAGRSLQRGGAAIVRTSFPFLGVAVTREAGEAVLLEPVAGEGEVWDGGLARSGAGAGAEEGGDAQFAGFAGAASGAGAVGAGRGCGVAVGAHGGSSSAGQLRVFGVGPGEGGGEAGDRRRELGGFGAGDGVELAGEGVADGGVLLVGFVVEHGDVVAWEADAELGGAEGVREDGVGVGAEGFFDGVEGPGFEGFGHQFFAPEPFAEGGGHQLDFSGGDGGGHFGAGPAEEGCCLRDADVGARV